MKRFFRIILVLLLIFVGGFYALNAYIYHAKQQGPKEPMDNTTPAQNNAVKITPISHASMVLTLSGQVVYTDPVGDEKLFAGQPSPNIILVTDIHGDHMDANALSAISKNDTVIVVPQAVKDQLPATIPGTMIVLHNGEKTVQKGLEIEAIPMYNIPESETAFHTKGRGNGYVISNNGERIYIAGDTSATPEMRALQDIDIAFVPMNLPYTMSVEEAAEAVAAFKPKVVHPYHYRGMDGFSDVNQFKELVAAKDPSIKVELLNFYPQK